MKRAVLGILLINVILALVAALIGWTMDWAASDYTLALLGVCGLSFFATAAAIGSSGPMSNVRGGAMTDAIGPGHVTGFIGGVVGMAVDDVAQAESARSSWKFFE